MSCNCRNQSILKAVQDAKENKALDQAELQQTDINSVACWLLLRVNNDNMLLTVRHTSVPILTFDPKLVTQFTLSHRSVLGHGL